MATDETYGCVWDEMCEYETEDWDALMEHSWTHRDGATTDEH